MGNRHRQGSPQVRRTYSTGLERGPLARQQAGALGELRPDGAAVGRHDRPRIALLQRSYSVDLGCRLQSRQPARPFRRRRSRPPRLGIAQGKIAASRGMLTDGLIESILTRLPSLRIGVLGDLFLDRYLDIDGAL